MNAQNNNSVSQAIDSLKNVVVHAKSDSLKINAYKAWDDLIYATDPNLDLELNKKIIYLADKNLKKKLNKNEKRFFLKNKANAFTNCGFAYEKLVNYPEALKNHNTALRIRKQLGDKFDLATAYNNIGNVYFVQGIFPEALKNYFTTLKIREEIDDKKGIADANNNLGAVYEQQLDFANALKQCQLALKMRKEIGDKKGIADSYNNIGSVYYRLGDNNKSILNYQEGLRLREEIGDKKGVAGSYNNIGLVYVTKGDYQGALENHFASLKIKEMLGEKLGIATSYNNIGLVYMALANPLESKKWQSMGLKLSKEIGSKNLITNCYSGLAKADSALGNFKDAFIHFKLFIAYRDSLNNEESTKQSMQHQMQYEFDKREAAALAEQEKREALARAEQEKKDEINRSEKKRQQIVIILVSCVLLIVAVFAYIVFKNLKLTRSQKQIIEQQKHLVEEKHKEITDSINYAERIQRSFLATRELLDEKLKDYFVLFQPKDVVSGDFYWASNLSNGNFAYVTADSTGHGVPGAIMSILNISSLELAVKENLVEPSQIFNYTRNEIISRLKKDGSVDGGKDGMDASIIVLNRERTRLICSAANNPVWIVRNNDIIEINPDKMPVGKHDKDQTPFSQQEFELHKGDLIYTLTDGMPDQFGGPKGKKYKYTKLKELLVSIAHCAMDEQKNKLADEFVNWKGELEQVDDVCLIGVRV